MVQTYHHSPHEVVEHGIVLVLPHTVVRMQVNMCFSQAMLLKKVVEQRDDGVGPLPCVAGFINEVDLPGDGFTTYPKDSPLARGEEVYGARLERI